jgi:hypothetical protein
MTRTYLDFDTISDALDGLVQIFEQSLRRTAVAQGKILDEHLSYELPELLAFLDNLAELTCMVFNDVQKIYLPHGRDWIKSRLYISLKKLAVKI